MTNGENGSNGSERLAPTQIQSRSNDVVMRARSNDVVMRMRSYGLKDTEGGAMGEFGKVIGVAVEKLGGLEPLIRDAAEIALTTWDARPLIQNVRFAPGPEDGGIELHHDEGGWYFEAVPTRRGVESIATRLDVPTAYLRRLVYGSNTAKKRTPAEIEAACGLLNALVQSHTRKDERVLVRNFNDPADSGWQRHPSGSDHYETRRQCRAVLSSSYKVMDAFDLLGPACRALSSHLPDDVTLDYHHVDYEGMAAALKFPKTEVVVGGRKDVYRMGFVLKNNEVGLGGLEVAPRLWREVCSNGMVIEEFVYRKIHLGGALEGAAREILEQSIYHAVQHALGSMPRVVEALNSAQQEPEANPLQRLSVIGEKADLSEDQRLRLVAAFGQESEATRHGVVQAVTATARDSAAVPDRQRLEALGGKLLMMSPAAYNGVFPVAA